MKLFKLEAIKSIDYDSYDSVLIRAKNEAAARAVAKQYLKGDENHPYNPETKGYAKIDFWGDKNLSSCDVVTVSGPEETIISSFNAG